METIKGYKILDLLAKLAGFKGVSYDHEMKDGRIWKIKNIKIEEIDITKDYKLD